MWLVTPLFTFCFLAVTLPAIGTLWVAQNRVLQANLVTCAVTQCEIISSTLGVDIRIEAPIIVLLAVLISDRLSVGLPAGKKSAVINACVAGELDFGGNVSCILRQSNFEDYLFGDILATDLSDACTAIAGLILLAVFIATRYRELLFIGVDPRGAIDAGINSRRIQIELASNKWSINAAYNCIFIIRRHCCSSCSPPGHCS